MNRKLKFEENITNIYTQINVSDYTENGFSDATLSSYSIYGRLGSEFDNSNEFANMCANSIINLFNGDSRLADYKFYIYINTEVTNVNSKIENYLKLWKKLIKTFNTDVINKGPECLLKEEDMYYFASIGEFQIQHLPMILQIQCQYLNESFIFVSKRKNLLSVEAITKTFSLAHAKDVPTIHGLDNEINYFKIFFNFCKREDFVFRVGFSGEEYVLDVIFKSKLI